MPNASYPRSNCVIRVKSMIHEVADGYRPESRHHIAALISTCLPQMTSISSTPVEIWQWILRYVISVPVFLDPNGITECPPKWATDDHVHTSGSCWNDERPYWDAERSRNICRRVCRAWDGYLGQRIGHRFVRVQDVAEGRIAASALSHAIRISVAYYSSHNLTTTGIPSTVYWHPDWCHSIEAFIALITNERLSRVQILVAPFMSLLSADVPRLAMQLPGLITIVQQGREFQSGNPLEHLPRLLHIYTLPIRYRKRRCCMGRLRRPTPNLEP
jgi:hypothetical protein